MTTRQAAYVASGSIFVVALAVQIAATMPACQSPAQVQAGLLTTEEIACLVDGLLTGVLTGTPEQIALGLQAVCKGVGRLGSSSTPAVAVEGFVTDWQKTEPEARTRWALWLAAEKRAAGVAPPSSSPR